MHVSEGARAQEAALALGADERRVAEPAERGDARGQSECAEQGQKPSYDRTGVDDALGRGGIGAAADHQARGGAREHEGGQNGEAGTDRPRVRAAGRR